MDGLICLKEKKKAIWKLKRLLKMMEFFQYLAYSKKDVATLLSILRYCSINMFDSKNLDLCMKLGG